MVVPRRDVVLFLLCVARCVGGRLIFLGGGEPLPPRAPPPAPRPTADGQTYTIVPIPTLQIYADVSHLDRTTRHMKRKKA